MRVLIVGGGGREHALAWKFKQDDSSVELIAAPGNPGIAELGECVPVGVTDIDALVALARDRNVDITVVGPEAPLALGIVNRFRDEQLPIFGPTREAAEIETSKAFAKELMVESAIPTARAEIHTDPARARAAARTFGAPVVIKASGLASGKGVIVCESIVEATAAIDDILSGNRFGDAGHEVLVEEFMDGEELSVFAITDGTRHVLLPALQDHKRLLDHDRGPNTGGMGAYVCPWPSATPRARTAMVVHRRNRCADHQPALARAARGGPSIHRTPVRRVDAHATGREGGRVQLPLRRPRNAGTHACALARTHAAHAHDACHRAEAPAHAPRLLPAIELRGACVTTVLAAGRTILSNHRAPATRSRSLPPSEHVVVFHAGTARRDGRLLSNGGRVLAVSASAPSIHSRRTASRAAGRPVIDIQFAGKQRRATDIGWRGSHASNQWRVPELPETGDASPPISIARSAAGVSQM